MILYFRFGGKHTHTHTYANVDDFYNFYSSVTGLTQEPTSCNGGKVI